jgi:hypothetical protein
VVDAVLDALLRYLVELDALGDDLRLLELLGQVPCDGLPFTVGVGRQQDLAGALGGGLQLLDDLLLARDDLVRLLKALFDVDSELLRKVLDVALRGQNLVLGAQVLLDRLGLRGRFDDDEGLSHQEHFLRLPDDSVSIFVIYRRPVS